MQRRINIYKLTDIQLYGQAVVPSSLGAAKWDKLVLEDNFQHVKVCVHNA